MATEPALKVLERNAGSRLLLAAILVCGAVLRLQAARGELWLDEVWSWAAAMSVRHPLAVFTSVHQDNNHYLNTLWIYLLGDQRQWWLYRLPSLAAGVGSIWLAWRIAARRSALEGFFAALLVAFSYFMILYSAEARGFALAAFFALLCLDQMQLYFLDRGAARIVIFNASAILGLLSQLTFIFPFLSLYVWGAVREFRRTRRWLSPLAHFFTFYFLTWLVWDVLCAVDLQYLVVGGGPSVSLIESLAAANALTLGAPLNPFACASLLALSALVVYAGCRLEARQQDSLVVFFGACLLVVPYAIMAATQQLSVYPRHFFVIAPFFLLLLAGVLSRMARGRAGLALPALLAALVCLASAGKILAFMPEGRGQYLEALRYMAGESAGNPRVGSTFDFQCRMLIEYYNRFLPERDRASFIDRKDWISGRPHWIIYPISRPRAAPGRFARGWTYMQPAGTIALPCGRYALDRIFYHGSEVSGSHWIVYRHVEQAPHPGGPAQRITPVPAR